MIQRLLRPVFGLLSLACAVSARAQSYSFTRFCGMPPTIGSFDGIGNQARFNTPMGVAVDANGNVFVADTLNHTIRKVTPAGVVSTIAGAPGQSGSSDGAGTNARFNQPYGIAVDASGTLWVADYSNHAIRQISPTGMVTTFAGELGVSGSNDGVGVAAHFKNPFSVVIDSTGNLYVSDRGNYTIRKITSAGSVSTFAGSAGKYGSMDGAGSDARFYLPAGLAIDSAGTLFLADSFAHTIRKITAAGAVSTLAGVARSSGTTDGPALSAQFNTPRGVVVAADGTLYICDSFNDCIRKLSTDGTVSTFAGYPGLLGNDNGTGRSAQFSSPAMIALDAAGNLYVADLGNHSIRKITSAAMVSLLAGGGGNYGSADGSPSVAQFYFASGIVGTSDGTLYIADSGNSAVRRISSDASVATMAGRPGYVGWVDGVGSAAHFSYPYGAVADRDGNLLVTDSVMNTIRRIAPDGTVTTLAGVASTTGGSDDGAKGTNRFSRPKGIALDGNGNAYIADTTNNTIRKLATDGTVSTLAGLAGTSGAVDGTGNVARFNSPTGIVFGPDGALYVTDRANQTIRKVTLQGDVTTVAGLAGSSGSADGTGSAARFRDPYGIAVDRLGNMFVADTDNDTIRMVTPGGVVSTIGGLAGAIGAVDGTGSAARFYCPIAIYCDAAGNLYIVDSLNSIIVRGAKDTTPVVVAAPQSFTVRPGGNVTMSVTATGGGLSYQWELNGTAIPGATGSTYTVSNAQAGQGGNYAVTISNSAGAVTSSKGVLTVSTTAAIGRISNLAIRSQAGTGAQTLIVGFSIGGNGTSGTKPLLVRAVGPALAKYGVTGVMSDPKLEIYSTNSGKMTENDNWGGDTQVATIGAGVGAFPLSDAASKDAALYNTTFTSGGYTAQVSGNGGTGVALAEIYDATPVDTFGGATPRLTNVSARTQVGTGGDILIAGFVVGGETAKNVLIRAIGPTLATYGVNGTLADPRLALYDSTSKKINENDDWGGMAALSAAFGSVGAFPLLPLSKDAALYVTLAPGNYTVQVSGVGSTTGVALVEVYEAP